MCSPLSLSELLPDSEAHFSFSTDSLVSPAILPSPSPLVLGLQVS